MKTIWIVTVTLFAYWAIGIAVYLCSGESDRIGSLWGMGLLYWILYAAFYPVRAMRHYSQYKSRYKKRGINRIQYLFGRRINRDKN